MFEKILIANRGEIACRVAATARRMGIETVAVYSDADRNARHVELCDEAVYLGASPAKESYLVAEKILAAAKQTGAQAIHPGYGFLSENEDFARACAEAGVVFIGPPPSAIAAMGLKSESKARMEKAGVPLVPGYHGASQDVALLTKEAARIGFPVLIKASAGGGGKGMRQVHSPEEFSAALDSCKREAKSSFNDDAVLIEKYLTKPRHIELQIFADAHGNCVHLFERDCSVQRRHQKVLEEAPAPGMTAERRAAMGAAAVAAAKAVGYVGAGTVEFIVEGDQFFFMEMNTRLQVEHPVTELIAGCDLVEWQLHVAAGGKLPVTQEQLHISGHAIEARIYAENPDKGFLPSTGRLTHLRFPKHAQFNAVHDVRVDSGVREGDEITAFYDPMIAKLIVHGEDRNHALALLSDALAQTQVLGPSTNVAFLKRVVDSHAFSAGHLDTGFIAKHEAELLPPPSPPPAQVLSLAAAFLLAQEAKQAGDDPWSLRNGWRANQQHVRTLKLGDQELALTYTRDGYLLNGAPLTVPAKTSPYALALRQNEDTLAIFLDGQLTSLSLQNPLTQGGGDDAHGGRLVAPMPGKIVALLAQPGTAVKKGAPLLVMEAMKMEHTLTAPADGQVTEFLYAPADQVAEGAELLKFTAS